MAPTPPNVRTAPGDPWRSSMSGGLAALGVTADGCEERAGAWRVAERPVGQVARRWLVDHQLKLVLGLAVAPRRDVQARQLDAGARAPGVDLEVRSEMLLGAD